jgi:DNA-binding NtrC family response regulator
MNPLTQNPTAQDPARQVAAAGKAVLVVDDEQNFLALLRWFLSNRGYVVETASNAEDALKLMDKRSFELALVDIRMGPMDGLMLLEELKRRLPALRVVMMTAYPTVGSIKQSHDKGASAFLTKPVDLQHLMRTIQGLV